MLVARDLTPNKTRQVDPEDPKSLGDPAVQASRRMAIYAPAVEPLNRFVDELRAERRCGSQIPYFDPLDGGIEARALFLLEAPGRRAVSSGFVSRNNPDDTAKNFLLLSSEAGIHRKQVVIWNVVPWYLGTAAKLQPPTKADISAGSEALARLLPLLPKLEIALLVGNSARVAQSVLTAHSHRIGVIHCPHPSPMYVNRSVENRARAREGFVAAAGALQRVSPA